MKLLRWVWNAIQTVLLFIGLAVFIIAIVGYGFYWVAIAYFFFTRGG